MREQIAVVESGVDALHADEAANEQRRADEQHERQRDFADDEAVAQALPASARARTAAARVAQRLVEVRSRRLKRRREAEQQSRSRRQRRS